MTFRELLRSASDVPDRERLLSGLRHWSFGESVLHENEEADPETEAMFLRGTERLRAHEPLQYILGEAPFYGRMFLVNEHVLIPRFDTEILVEEALVSLRDIRKEGHLTPSVLDLCTGSGCIAVTLLLEEPGIALQGSDLSAEALSAAKRNEERLAGTTGTIRFVQSDLFQEIHDVFDLVVTNPPYIRDADIETLDPEVRDHEPRIALSGGEDGLIFVRRIAEEALPHLNDGGRILMEIGDEQGTDAVKIFEYNGFREVRIIRDLTGRDRVLSARKGCK